MLDINVTISAFRQLCECFVIFFNFKDDEVGNPMRFIKWKCQVFAKSESLMGVILASSHNFQRRSNLRE